MDGNVGRHMGYGYDTHADSKGRTSVSLIQSLAEVTNKFATGRFRVLMNLQTTHH